MKSPLVSKNRAANELREQAHKLRSELMDPATSFTAEEVEKRTADIRALEIHVPTALKRRYQLTGYAELIRYTSLVRNMILEGKVLHQLPSAFNLCIRIFVPMDITLIWCI